MGSVRRQGLQERKRSTQGTGVLPPRAEEGDIAPGQNTLASFGPNDGLAGPCGVDSAETPYEGAVTTEKSRVNRQGRVA